MHKIGASILVQKEDRKFPSINFCAKMGSKHSAHYEVGALSFGQCRFLCKKKIEKILSVRSCAKIGSKNFQPSRPLCIYIYIYIFKLEWSLETYLCRYHLCTAFIKTSILIRFASKLIYYEGSMNSCPKVRLPRAPDFNEIWFYYFTGFNSVQRRHPCSCILTQLEFVIPAHHCVIGYKLSADH